MTLNVSVKGDLRDLGREIVIDGALGDSDKSFTVTDEQVWKVLAINVQFTSTATNGIRRLVVDFLSGPTLLARYSADYGQAKNKTAVYTLGPGLELADIDDRVTVPIVSGPLLEGDIVRVYDIDAIDPTGDNMIVSITALTFDRPLLGGQSA